MLIHHFGNVQTLRKCFTIYMLSGVPISTELHQRRYVKTHGSIKSDIRQNTTHYHMDDDDI